MRLDRMKTKLKINNFEENKQEECQCEDILESPMGQ